MPFKRLFPLLVLLATTWIATGPLTASAQSKSARTLVLIARNDTASTFINTPVDVMVLANDEDTNPGTKIVLPSDAILVPPQNGAALIDRNRTPDESDDFITYTPDAGYLGRDSLRYKIQNTFGAQDEAWVILFVNRPPTANPDAFEVPPNTTTQLDVLANDTDPDGDVLQVEAVVTAPMHGTAVSTGTMISYTPATGFTGRDSLRYAMSDGKNGRDTSWVYLTVNRPPVAAADAATTLPGTAVTVEVLANDTDPDGGALTVTAIAQAAAQGTAAVIDGGARVQYTPNPGFSGVDTFTYRVADPIGGTDEAIVTVTVNTPPVAADDDVSTLINTAVDIAVLTNDTDADGNALTVSALTAPPSNGMAAIIDNSTRVRYTPDAGFFGTDSFSYTIVDGRGGSDTAVVTVAVLADAAVQIIHNTPGIGVVDLYVDDVRVVDDLAFQEATPYLNIPAGPATVDVTAGGAVNNDAPLLTASLTLEPMEAYVAVANGVVGVNFNILVKADARMTSQHPNPNFAEFFLVHGVPDAPAAGIDVRLLDAFANNEPLRVLADNLLFGNLTAYMEIDAELQNIEFSSFDNAEVYDVFRFDLSALQGETFVLLASGLLDDGSRTLIGFDAQGDPVPAPTVTATDAAGELPEAFALLGNYPNPFNPATTIRFDLPEAAQVRVEVVDVMGRTVLTAPPTPVAAGAGRTLRLDAARLASGTYFYRVVAVTAGETLTATGRMTLIK